MEMHNNKNQENNDLGVPHNGRNPTSCMVPLNTMVLRSTSLAIPKEYGDFPLKRKTNKSIEIRLLLWVMWFPNLTNIPGQPNFTATSRRPIFRRPIAGQPSCGIERPIHRFHLAKPLFDKQQRTDLGMAAEGNLVTISEITYYIGHPNSSENSSPIPFHCRDCLRSILDTPAMVVMIIQAKCRKLFWTPRTSWSTKATVGSYIPCVKLLAGYIMPGPIPRLWFVACNHEPAKVAVSQLDCIIWLVWFRSAAKITGIKYLYTAQ